jgi:hypothetical protein
MYALPTATTLCATQPGLPPAFSMHPHQLPSHHSLSLLDPTQAIDSPPSPGEVHVLRDDLCLKCTRHHLATTVRCAHRASGRRAVA